MTISYNQALQKLFFIFLFCLIFLLRLVIFIIIKLENMKNLLVSGSTNELVEWDLEETLSSSHQSLRRDRDRLSEYEWDNRIARNGMTYLEIEQFNNTFNLK